MKSLLRFTLMISLVVVGKLNQVPVASALITHVGEPAALIPVHSAALQAEDSAIPAHHIVESGKFRSWRLISDRPTNE